MNFHYQLESEDNDRLFNVEGRVPNIDDIRYGELRFGTVDVDFWEEYEKQNEPTAQGTYTVEVHRDGDEYYVERIILESINDTASGTANVPEELKRLILDKLEWSIRDELDFLTEDFDKEYVKVRNFIEEDLY